jgi:hypothetical protein
MNREKLLIEILGCNLGAISSCYYEQLYRLSSVLILFVFKTALLIAQLVLIESSLPFQIITLFIKYRPVGNHKGTLH